MEEATLLDYNKTRPKGSLRLVAVYPSDGTFVSDNPLLVLDAPWVTAEQQAGGRALAGWLSGELTAAVAAKYGFRPGDPEAQALPPIERARGVDPAQPARTLSLPAPEVLARIKEAWREDRKPANVMLVVDVSGSMQDDDKLVNAKQGLEVFLRQLSPRDRVGLTSFSGGALELVPIGPFAQNRGRLQSYVRDLIADGDTALYEAAEAGWAAVDRLDDDTRINAVVVLSDGADTASRRSLDQVLARFTRRAEGDGRQIRVFTIAYGEDANTRVLERLAAASGGKAYEGDPENIGAVYLQISSFF
jgi:Ca-activated chloride channel family protein